MPQSVISPTTATLGAPPMLEVVRQRALDLLLSGAPLEGDLPDLVEADAVLMGLVQRLVRCPLYDGAKLRGLRTHEALARIGRRMLVHAITYLPGIPERESRDDVAPACHDWAHGVAVAAAARWLASSGEYGDAEEAYQAGLFHDLRDRTGVPVQDRDAAVSRLAQRWHLSEHIARIASQHGDTDPGAGGEQAVVDAQDRLLLAVVKRACRISAEIGIGRLGTARQRVPVAAVDLGAAEAARAAIAKVAGVLGLEPASPSDFPRLLTNEEVRLGDVAHDRRELGADTDLVAEAHRRIVSSRRLGAVSDILTRGLVAIREGLELDRVVLLEPHPNEPYSLRGRAASDPSDLNYSTGVHGVTIELDGGGALQQVLERGRALLGGSEDEDRRVKQQLGVESFAGAILQAGTTPMGLVVADRFFSGEAIRPRDVRHLELLCDTLGLVLDNKVLDEQGRKLRTLAEKDELTGINNRRNIVSILGTEIRRARRFDKPLSIALLDVDHFKRWNDVHGHQVGDMVLQAVAQLIAACSREIDHYGRYGGEEFLVVLPETGVQHGVLYSERLRVTLEGHCADMFTAYSETPLTVSIGVASLRPGDDIESLVRRADEAMYQAKSNGRNRVCVEPSMLREPDSADVA